MYAVNPTARNGKERFYLLQEAIDKEYMCFGAEVVSASPCHRHCQGCAYGSICVFIAVNYYEAETNCFYAM